MLRINLRKVICWELWLYFIINFIIAEFHAPTSLLYIIDIINVLVFILMFRKKRNIKRLIPTWSLIFFIIICLISALINAVNPLYVIWEFNNVFRFFIYFISCVTILKQEDITNLFNNLYRIEFLNLILCLYQFFIMNCSQDRLGGIFGTIVGCNAALNIYMCFLITYGLNMYLNKKVRLFRLIITAISVLVISAMAELRFFFIEFILIVSLSLICNKPSKRTILMIVTSIVAVVIGLNIFSKLFPQMYADLIDIEGLYKTMTLSDKSVGYGIGRLNAFEKINTIFFQGNVFYNILGFGFGYCTVSSIPIFNSNFYEVYKDLNYNWLSHAMLFLQTGYLGTLMYISFFISIIITTIRKRNIISALSKEYFGFQIVMTFLFIINFLYNNSARIAIAYMWGIFLCSIFVLLKVRKIR